MANEKMTKEWLTHSSRDLRAAKALFDLGAELYTQAGFHAQQAAEKAIKGFLVSNGLRPPKTHSIDDLIQLVELKDSELANKLKPATALTDLAVAYRYPDAQKTPLTSEDISQAISNVGPPLAK